MPKLSTSTTRTPTTQKTGLWIGLVALVLLVALVTGSILLVRNLSEYRQDQKIISARDDSVKASRDVASTMFGYDFRNVTDHVKRTREMLTGGATKQYDEQVDRANLEKAVAAEKLSVEVTIQNAGNVKTDGKTATVLLFINQSTKKGDEVTKITPSQLTYSLVNDGGWKVNNIELLDDTTLASVMNLVPKGSAQDSGVAPGQQPTPAPQPAPESPAP